MGEHEKDNLRHLKWIFWIGLVGLVMLIIGYLLPDVLERYRTDYFARGAIRLASATIGGALIIWFIQRLFK